MERLEVREKIKYWLFQKGKNCKRCCLRCEYYDICRWDVLGKLKLQNNRTISILAVELARNGNRNGLLYRICKYIEFRQKERKRNE